jgi:N-glycosylase/DNA lyase
MSTKVRIPHIDLDQTLGCGQTFRWRRAGDGTWRGPIGDCLVTLRASGQWVHADATPKRRDLKARVSTYLRAGDDVGEVQSALSRDPVMAKGAAAVEGLRIVKMDEWECLASYALATYANVPRISRMIEGLATRYGDPIAEGVHAFPTIAQMRGASLGELRGCGLGYRAEYLAEMCGRVDDARLAEMRGMPDEELREALLELPGVGEKVADCVSLFGFGRLSAFPIDVWMQRALLRLYGVKGSYSRLRDFAAGKFGGYAGYAQEYLYYNERTLNRGEGCVFTRRGVSSGRTP